WACEARRYYFNIVGKYGGPVQTVLKKLAGLEIKSIRSLHGPILDGETEKYLHLYDIWSSYRSECEGVFIACASIYGGTMKAAQYIAEELRKKGVKVSLSDLCDSDMAENVGNAFKYSKMVLAASSYDGGLFTPMYDFLHRLQIKGYCKRKVALVENGSWAPSAGRVMREMLSSMKELDLRETTVTIKSTVKSTDIEALDALVNDIAL
ncbi:MAG: FprA family A-type flavoprotein, partial [Bacteroidales bacterium]|nr:FprA family A-type flavoprotein [Bacteroidales bacterium]